MNDIVRTNIKERLVKAIESEKLLAQDVAAIFQMHPSYISWFKNVKYWDKIGEKFWERVLAWINSGQSLREWSEKHGKVLNENSPTDTKRDKTGTEKKEIVSEPIKTDISLHDLATYPRKNMIEASDIKSDPELLKEAEGLREKITLIDLLKERRVALIEETNAIDNLLRHYTRLMPSPWK